MVLMEEIEIRDRWMMMGGRREGEMKDIRMKKGKKRKKRKKKR